MFVAKSGVGSKCVYMCGGLVCGENWCVWHVCVYVCVGGLVCVENWSVGHMCVCVYAWGGGTGVCVEDWCVGHVCVCVEDWCVWKTGV